MKMHLPFYRQRNAGSTLIEALCGIMIFSIGVLALIGLQMTSIKQVSQSKFRSDASLMANDLIGQMWVSNRSAATLQTNFNSPGGAAYSAWKDRVSGLLPGVATYPPTVSVAAVAGGPGIT